MGRRLESNVVLALAASFWFAASAGAEVKTVAELVSAVTGGTAGDTVVVGPGTFRLTEPLRPPSGMQIRGAGVGKTILTHAASWASGNGGLDQDEGATRSAVDCSKYLIDLRENATTVVIADMTLTGPTHHGGICGFSIHGLELTRLELKQFLWAGLRAFIMDGAKIHDNSFFDAGGKSNGTTGSSGGALYLTYTSGSEIYDNRFSRSAGNDGYGIKGREARNVRLHHNTIETDFAIELPFENDHFVEIDHNYLGGTISIPKWGGGTFPAGGYAFHVHHNYFKTSYAFEYQRNGIEIDHNVFDFSTQADGGNLISSFDSVAATGGTQMHDNLISNPGRGLYWNEGVYNNFAFYNNHVRGTTTVTPRTEGLFDFRPDRDGTATDWKTIVLRDNVVELTGTSRPLMRNTASYAALIENNTLAGVSDSGAYANKATGKPRGPSQKLCFRLGASREWTINGWELVRSPSPVTDEGCGTTAPGDGGVDGRTADGTGSKSDRGAVDGGASDAVAERTDASGAASHGDSGCSCSVRSSDARAVDWTSFVLLAVALLRIRSLRRAH